MNRIYIDAQLTSVVKIGFKNEAQRVQLASAYATSNQIYL